MPYGLLIGLGAGLVSAVLFASASTGTMLGLLVLFFLSPLPVAIAGLGWGAASAATAAASGFGLLAIIGSGRAATFYLIALGLPTVLLSYLSLLNREVQPPGLDRLGSQVEWYPIGKIVTVAAILAGCLASFALFATASDVEGLRAETRAFLQTVFVNPAALPSDQPALGEREIAAYAELMVVSFAGIVATAWTALAMLNLWLAGLVTRQSGRLVRPWPDLTDLRLPRGLPLAFALAIAATFLPGYPGLMASGFASALMFAFMLVGLAVIHHITRGLALRPVILGAAYASLVFLSPVSGVLFAIVGLTEPISPLRRGPPPAPPPKT
jgi:hypothetical protein